MPESGPDFPRPAPKGIGQFIIGVTPIGDVVPPFDYWRTIMSQYANSPIITGLISSFFAAVDQTRNVSELYDNVFNVLTAVGTGLDIWGRIVGVSRVLQLPVTGAMFDFKEAGASAESFSQAPFNPGSAVTTAYALSDSAFRILVLAKALANISNGSTKSINAIMLALFPGRGNVFVVDNLNMTMVYRFRFSLSAVESAIVTQSGVLPRPAGVSATVQTV